MHKPSVAIIIVSYNSHVFVIDCLLSLSKITYPNYKIFIIDNGSEEKSIAQLRPLQNDIVSIIETGENLGFSGGNNIGIKKALTENFDYVLLLNNDTTVDPHFLDELITIDASNKKIGALVPKIYYHDDPKRIWFGGGTFGWLRKSTHVNMNKIDSNPNETQVKSTDFITGCTFLVKTGVIKEVGLMPEDYFLYHEDVDWSFMIKKAGYKLIYVPSAKIYHKVSRTVFAQLKKPIIHYYDTRNFLLLAKRHAPLISLIGIYIWSIYYYIKQTIKIVLLPHKRETSKMIMRSIEDFYRGKFGKYTDESKVHKVKSL